MAEVKWTPWSYESASTVISGSDGRPVAYLSIRSQNSDGDIGPLLAAAPEVTAALAGIIATADDYGCTPGDVTRAFAAARAALAKARGE